MTLGKIMASHGGIGPGFDALRIFLAFAVIFRHCFPLTYGDSEEASSGMFWSATNAIVPAFFAVSGFLVMGSAQRLDLKRFAASRVLRIVPALVVDTLVTVVLIGIIFTTLPLASFFSNPDTYSYLFNIIGNIHWYLPGVFEDNPHAGVINGSLWTIGPELGCYLALGFIMYFGLHQNVKVILLIMFSIIGLILVNDFSDAELPALFRKVFGNPGALLVPNFLLGAALFLVRDRILYSRLIFGACVLIVGCSGLFLPEESYASVPILSIFLMPVYAYLALFIGCTEISEIPFFSRGDYSYGVYLYGFPIQQSIVAATAVANPFMLFAMTLIPVVGLAVMSWHFVEKPALRFRKGFSMAAKRAL